MLIVKKGSQSYIDKQHEKYHKRYLIKKFKCNNCGCKFKADALKKEWEVWSVSTISNTCVLRAKCPYCNMEVRKECFSIVRAYIDDKL